MKVAVLWTELSGYLNACLKELARRDGVELFVAHEAPSEIAPFDISQFEWIKDRLTWKKQPDESVLSARLSAFQPDVLIIPTWHVPVYRHIAKRYSGKAWRVMAMDNCWMGTLKQRIGVKIAPFHVRPLADAVWLPGERQAVFARKLGFEPAVIMRGSLSCDQQAFDSVYWKRIHSQRAVPRSFIFAGRFAREKGLDTLAAAYMKYRENCSNPWPLVCCGHGSMRSCLEGKEGIRIEGFVQPERLPEMFASAGCFVLPSTLEPWGVVVHEATSAGLLILASEKVGATPHLVQPNYNGFIFGCSDVAGLAFLMSRISAMDDERLDAMSRASYLLARQFSPARWADTLLETYAASGKGAAVPVATESATSTNQCQTLS